MKWHPDRNQQGTEEQKAKADKMFKEINEAYSVLSDKDKRRQFDLGAYDPSNSYDMEGSAPGGPQMFRTAGAGGRPGAQTFFFTSSGGQPGGAQMNFDLGDLFKMFGGGGAGGMFGDMSGDTEMSSDESGFANMFN